MQQKMRTYFLSLPDTEFDNFLTNADICLSAFIDFTALSLFQYEVSPKEEEALAACAYFFIKELAERI